MEKIKPLAWQSNNYKVLDSLKVMERLKVADWQSNTKLFAPSLKLKPAGSIKNKHYTNSNNSGAIEQ